MVLTTRIRLGLILQSNVTLVGSLTAATGDDPTTATETGKTRALKLRAGTRGQLYNFVMYNFSSGVEVEHDVTLAGMESNSLNLKNSDIYNAKPWAYKKTATGKDAAGNDIVPAYTGTKPFETAEYNNNVQAAGTPSYITNVYVGTNPTGAINPTTLDSWFTAANYKGAVSSSDNWVGAWARASAN